MKLKMRKQYQNSTVRMESTARIQEVFIKDDLTIPSTEKIEICFSGGNGSGIIELSPQELKSLYSKVAPYLNLVKKSKQYIELM